ncbi:MAG: hypothetical protein ACRC8S_17580 [Fimbriiglobus sp.]
MGEATQLHESDWRAALAEMEQAVSGCLKNLDHHETQFSDLLRTESNTSQWSLLIPKEAKPEIWEASTLTTTRQVEMIEKQLDEQSRLWGGWLETFSGWRSRLEQAAKPE